MQRNLVAEFHRENASLLVKQRVNVCEPPFVGVGLGVTYAIHLYLVGKLVVVSYNCTFLLALMAEALISRNRPLLKGG